MTSVKNHHLAMEFADEADALKRAGHAQKALIVYKKAFEKEREAALSFNEQSGEEPTRSVLFRSAASLAIESCEPDMALEMIMEGLFGNPPSEIREELLELLNKLEIVNDTGSKEQASTTKGKQGENAIYCRFRRPIGRRLSAKRISKKKSRGSKRVLSS